MAPLSQAVNVKLDKNYKLSNGVVYGGKMDPEWTIGSVPNGGYVLALVVDTCMQFQRTTNHPDPIHVTAHFLNASSASAPFEIHVRVVKKGRGFSNLTAELIQESRVRVATHIIFGVLSDSTVDPADPDLTLRPPSGYARRIPLYSHPSQTSPVSTRSTWNFHNRIRLTRDMDIIAKNAPDSTYRTNASTVGGDGTEGGGWIEFTDDVEVANTPMIVFLADIFQNTPELLPKGERNGLGSSWFPTIVMTIEFKSPIPEPTSRYHSRRTFGLYSQGRFMNGPLGRHDIYVEVWTSPGRIGQGEEVEGWREKQVCLATSTQMALVVPLEVNLSRNQTRASESKL